jgi:pimeloyl-ACP methyl ester carboxylesterase
MLPNPKMLLLEARVVPELAAFLLAQPLLRRAPRGDGHPVMVLPGLAASDLETAPLRLFLRRLGYDAHGWGLGRNEGPTDRVLDGLDRRLADLSTKKGRKVSLVGWSLGGILARLLASSHAHHVRQVITLAAPFRPLEAGEEFVTRVPDEQATRWRQIEAAARAGGIDKPPVPSTAIWSRSDGVVGSEVARQDPEPRHENVEVASTHFGIVFNLGALVVVADRLAQPEGEWQPFRPGPETRLLWLEPFNRQAG